MPTLEPLSALGHDLRRLELADIDLDECGGGFGTTNAVAADFDGDGALDSAMLVAFEISPEVTEWQGQTLHQASIAVVVLFGSTTIPRFEVLEQSDRFLPTDVVLELVPPARYKIRDEVVSLDRPSLTVTYCGKSAAVYTWRCGKFVVIPVSD